MTDLKPCPFCGGTNVHVDMDYRVGIPVWVVDCNGCATSGPVVNEAEGEAAAVEAWNRRTPGPKLRTRTGSLSDEVSRMMVDTAADSLERNGLPEKLFG